MTLLLNTSLKVTLLVVAGLLAAGALRRRSAAVRHFVLAAALACAATMPAVRIVAPAWHGVLGIASTTQALRFVDRPLAVFDAIDLSSTPGGGQASVRAGATSARWLGIAWAGGVAVSLLFLISGLSRLTWLESHSDHITDGPWVRAAADIARAFGLRRTPAILQSTHPSLLVTWGFVRPSVLLPEGAQEWPDSRIRIVLGHELAHIRRGDWIVQIASEVIRAAYWFNPLVWIACQRLRLESEQACDDTVLDMGVDGPNYASELVDLARTFNARQRLPLPAAAIARPSSLERRVRAMLNGSLNRDPLTRSASIAAAVLTVAVTLLVAGFGASAQGFSSVSGSLVDPLGRALPRATLTLSNPATQSKYEIKSDANGRYEFVGLPPGTYSLKVESMGFATVLREGVALSGQPFEQNVVMQVGSLQETITVDDRPSSAPQIRELANLGATANLLGRRGQPACTPSPVGGNILPPAKIRDVRPAYPAGAAPGEVRLKARIGVDGFVSSTSVVGDADPALANAALAAVGQWGFTPTLLDCEPIEVNMNVHISFVTAK
jgi:beta-lactamase regulating signal transducer with metallopeptidase domain